MAVTPSSSAYDCLVIGGGPAGLTAAIYLGRFRRNVLLVDDGKSRAALIPQSHNYPGFPYGISGPDLLKELRRQAGEYASLHTARIERLATGPEGFVAETNGARFDARRILIATGIVDEAPEITGLRDAVYRGALRFCPICDGYEAADKRIGVLGRLATAWKKALFLRTYSRDVTLLPVDTAQDIDPQARAQLAEARVEIGTPVADVERAEDRVTAVLRDGRRRTFDVIYPALGSQVRSELALALGARCNDMKCLEVDAHQRTSVQGLYAAGDVVSDLHQIAVATGHAALAATDIHNSLPPNYR
jgi:thioredoxin reductase (NADPH)